MCVIENYVVFVKTITVVNEKGDLRKTFKDDKKRDKTSSEIDIFRLRVDPHQGRIST